MWNPSSQGDLKPEISLEIETANRSKLKGSSFLSTGLKEFWVLDLMSPIENFLFRNKVKPNTITLIGFAITILASLFLASGHLIWAGWLVIWAGCCDFLDGRIARKSNLTSESGGFLDSVLDRYMDGAVLFALAVFFHDSWVLWLIYLMIIGSFTTPYIRAKAESLQIPCDGGQMQRPERVVYIGVGCVISGYFACLNYPFVEKGASFTPYPLIVAVFIVAFFSNKVAFERFWSTYLVLKSREK